MNNSRNDILLRAGAVVAFAVAACLIPSSAGTPASVESGETANGTPVARGMLIPARLRLIVRFKPSQSA